MDIKERRARRRRRLEMVGEKTRRRTSEEFRADNERLKAEYDRASSDEERLSIEALFLEQNSGQIREMAWRMQGTQQTRSDGQVSDFDDLYQEGILHAVTAFRKWEPSKGSWGQWVQLYLKKLSTLVWREDFKSLTQDQFFGRLQVKRLVAAGHSVEEIAEIVGRDVAWVEGILFPERALSLDFVLAESGDSDSELTLADKIVDPKAVVGYTGDFWVQLNEALDYVGANVFVGRRLGQMTKWPELRQAWLDWSLNDEVTIISLLPILKVSREQARLRLYSVSSALAHPVVWRQWPEVSEAVSLHLRTIRNKERVAG